MYPIAAIAQTFVKNIFKEKIIVITEPSRSWAAAWSLAYRFFEFRQTRFA